MLKWCKKRGIEIFRQVTPFLLIMSQILTAWQHYQTTISVKFGHAIFQITESFSLISKMYSSVKRRNHLLFDLGKLFLSDICHFDQNCIDSLLIRTIKLYLCTSTSSIGFSQHIMYKFWSFYGIISISQLKQAVGANSNFPCFAFVLFICDASQQKVPYVG